MANFIRQSITITALTEGAANTVYTVPVGKEAVLIGARFANQGGANELAINLFIEDGGANKFYLSGANTPLPIGSALEMQQGKTVLNAGDIIKTFVDVANECDFTLSILEKLIAP